MDLLSLHFMQRALLAALLSGVISPAIGNWIVQRRLSLLGDGLGHVAIAGVGLAFLTGTAPLPLAIAVCIAGALAVELLRQRGRATGDVGLAVLFYGGLASGVLMAGLAGQGAGALSQFLFGSLTTVNRTDLWVILGLAVVVLVPAVGLAPQLFAVCSDEEFARVLGLRVRTLNLLIVALAAVTVTVSMRTVGLLLVSAMMVIPVATSENLVVGYRSALALAMGLGAVIAVGGTAASYYLDTASGATIVVLAIVVFLLSRPLNRLRHIAISAITDEEPHIIAEGHPHAVDGHAVAIQHEDHVDYLHDGHRHVPHEDHFDEH